MNWIKSIKVYLEGKKTYILAVVLAAYSVSIAFGWINWTPEQETAMYGLLGSLLGISIKAGLNR